MQTKFLYTYSCTKIRFVRYIDTLLAPEEDMGLWLPPVFAKGAGKSFFLSIFNFCLAIFDL